MSGSHFKSGGSRPSAKSPLRTCRLQVALSLAWNSTTQVRPFQTADNALRARVTSLLSRSIARASKLAVPAVDSHFGLWEPTSAGERLRRGSLDRTAVTVRRLDQIQDSRRSPDKSQDGCGRNHSVPGYCSGTFCLPVIR